MFTRLFSKTIFIVMGMALMPYLNFAHSTPEKNLAQMSIFDRMYQDDVVEMTIKTDLEKLDIKRNSDEYQPASLSMEVGKSEFKFDIKVKTRGKFRRRICDFPPLKLKFSKKDLNENGFSNFNKLKLVTHCMNDKEISRELVMREFLAYELYQELTENSFRVQLAKISYIDENTGNKIKRWGFLIESTGQMAARLGAEEVEAMGQTSDQFHATIEKVSSSFQYMIGNVDYNLEMNKNVKLIRKYGTNELIPVPYDFDFSGLVNAPYARPKSDFDMTNIRDRFYVGLTPSKDDLFSTFEYFRTKKKELVKKVYKFSQLSEESKVDMVTYIKSFYDLISDETVGRMDTLSQI